MGNAKLVFDFIFHWAGVWAVMVYGTVVAVRTCAFVRRLAHDREKKRLFDEAMKRIPTPPKPTEKVADTNAVKAG